ncbi:hypothetical protein ACP4OV_027154 [Aristida adscensionis]
MMDMKPAACCSALLLLFMLLLLCSADVSSKVYIVYMGEKKHDDPSVVTASHHQTLASVLSSEDEARQSIIYNYKHELPEVVTVMPNTYHQLQTTRSWDFLGQNYYKPSGLLKKANYGKDIIVGVIDSGIWPESRSFDDHGYGPVPRRWKGVCQTGEAFNATSCNRKIIGARWYSKDTPAELLKGEHLSPRDFGGHGTHCASTIAGVPVQNASHGGFAAGVARGGAPHARLAVYKACWGRAGSCSAAALIAAIDDAIHDGVDVLSLSIGNVATHTPGTLHAVARGITVVFAAGNDGPVPQTVANASPWLITVAASTIDRSFPSVISLSNGQKLVGQSLYNGDLNTSDVQGIAYGAGCDKKTLESINITGTIIVCFAPWQVASSLPASDMFVEALDIALNASAKGIIFAQYTTSLVVDVLQLCKSHGILCVVVDYEIGNIIFKKIKDGSLSVEDISPAVAVIGDRVPSPRVAAFSSRGPSMSFPAILKPDIAAPGSGILAAKGNSYVFMSGTSMACPHVSAIVTLLKSVHPDWSPAMIKSAIITTASVIDHSGIPIQAEGQPRKLADPFDFGAGHIDPNRLLTLV